MLDEKDLEAIEKIVTRTVTKSESMVLDELERLERKTERRFAKIEKDIEELKSVQRMIKNEQDTIDIMLKNLNNHEHRIARLEARNGLEFVTV